ncbi:acid phosphatase [Carbonactinospora thermoautotrophica]|uniref:Acid phosphatase n=2 Tax=Carbonactinospora thermoautotrophica TaxID=1469144 RepID=A0A132MR21_9ACTN|nr:bifunctional RNase H/acid phosphatase [Carbonactinospora thermoautotrophica]KWX00196.1 acid phosphatase [Carbonactinospora thermoautotrophica]
MRRLIVEADGGSRGNPGPAAYGALVRDADTGEVLREIAEYLGTATNNVAEYRGLIAGLRAAREVDPDAKVEVRMDSRLVVEQVTGRWKVNNPGLRPLVAEAREIYPVPDQVTFTWVPREANREADRLVNQALDEAAAAVAERPATPAQAPAAEVTPAQAPAVVDEAEVEPAPAVGWGRATGSPTTLVLLRHGETALSAQKRFSGSGSDPELSERGRWQAEQVAARLGRRGAVQVIVSSPLRRCLQTAAICQRLLPGVEVEVEPGFREADFGAWDGYTFAEVQQRWPRELKAWLASSAVAPPGGESFAAVSRRVQAARDAVLSRHAGKTVLVVSHVTPIKTLIRLALEAPTKALYRMELDPAGLSVIQWYPDGNASVRVFNDTAHLWPG